MGYVTYECYIVNRGRVNKYVGEMLWARVAEITQSFNPIRLYLNLYMLYVIWKK